MREAGGEAHDIKCETKSVAGSVSQRACVFCGSRVVLYPIADALHLVHGAVGCAAYTWDIRGALSSGPQLHRLSFSSNLQEKEVVFGGEKKLERVLDELIDTYEPKAAFVYSTCLVGVIGDDVEAICRKMSEQKGIPVIPVHSEGFKGTKKDGYRAACDALLKLIGSNDAKREEPRVPTINILGDFNLAGELWILKSYYEEIGIRIQVTLTGDSRIEQIKQAQLADLNLVQCSGSMMFLAKEMQRIYGIPFKKVSYFGLEDMSEALYSAVQHFEDKNLMTKTAELVRREIRKVLDVLAPFKEGLQGKRAAIYVGGAFKAISLIKALRMLGVKTVIAGSQTGGPDDYKMMETLADPETWIVDDTNPVELSEMIRRKGADILIGGVKERPIAYKLGIAFCDHNHERKEALAGYEGMVNFAKEIHASVNSPVWNWVRSNGPWE
jgi:nitrogenase molybdenum-cofactor synthesis protein NifE